MNRLARAPVWVWLLIGLAVAFLIYGGVKVAANSHRDPTQTCLEVMHQVEIDRAPATISASAWNAAYEDCVARERDRQG